MPRTIETIVQAHQDAAERRAAGRPIWDHKVFIKHLLSDDASDENAQSVGRQVAVILRASPWLRLDASRRTTVVAERFEGVESVEDFNDALDMLYDLADADRVWIG